MGRIGDLVKQWLAVDINETTRAEIKKLYEADDDKELEKRLGSRLRSKMEAGFARMNDVTVLQASQGLATYVKQHPTGKLSVVIGHDHRHNSARFAELAALAFVQLGFTVYRFGLVHTPLVPFGVDELGASCGVMVTASHNPAADNGYKVYWGNGCQIIPPHDAGIAECIQQNLNPWTWDIRLLEKHSNLIFVDTVKSVEESYFARLKTSLNYTQNIESSGFKFVYTPMHGVGLPYIKRACEMLGLGNAMLVVEEQATPDPEFHTVKFPNPEEEGALDLAMELADKENAQLILANDPDADRFVAAVKSANGKWCQLTGNQIGAIFGHYAVKRYEESGGDMSKLALLNSTVSSEFNAYLAEQKGFKFIDTLTGFKWIGNGAIALEKAGYTVPFAYEEALGYMFGGVVHDKDGVSSAYVFMQLAGIWAAQNTNGLQVIHQLYQQTGFFAEHNSYYIVPDPSVTTKIFDEVRKQGSPFPSHIGPYTVEYWRDLTVGYDSSTADHKPVLPVSSSTQMITARVKSPAGEPVRFTARGSGTEPKLKIYIEAKSDDATNAQNLANDLWETLGKEWVHKYL